MRVGILALQGAVQDHLPHLAALDAEAVIVKDPESLETVDRLILPGGESTVMARYLARLGLKAPLLDRIRAGMPVWGICAGCILLAEKVDGSPGPLGVLPVSVVRNAYGRQLASDTVPLTVPELGLTAFPATFIRAPRITDQAADATVLARRDHDPVFVRHRHVLATTFHPELTDSPAFHRYFLGVQPGIAP